MIYKIINSSHQDFVKINTSGVNKYNINAQTTNHDKQAMAKTNVCHEQGSNSLYLAQRSF